MPGKPSKAGIAVAAGAVVLAALGAGGLAFGQAADPGAGGGVTLRPSLGDITGSIPADGGGSADVAAEQQKALADIEASISLSKDRVDQLKKEIADMQGDRARQSAALIAAGERVKLAEADIAKLEDRLGELIAEELDVRGRLDGADATISSVLAALERISRSPPPALIVNPTDALGSARSALLISAILPSLQQKAQSVTDNLHRLSEVKADALSEADKLQANYEVLEEEQLRIATLIAARRQSEDRASAELIAEERDAEALAQKATGLKQLIADLTRRADAVAAATRATQAAESGSAAPKLDSDTIRLALANTERSAPAVPFAQARGYLAMPSTGVTVTNYGANDGFGGISKGMSVVTRAEAQVVAPADGWVLYRGQYLNYGQIVILNTGQDYTILLAGLAKVDVDIGQFVMMGEPVGTMGSRTIGRTVATSAGISRPTLYIEMRKDNEPVDPTGWWAQAATPTQNG
jgi:septal ring factor EnvC (AmiA/AmiB activator)